MDKAYINGTDHERQRILDIIDYSQNHTIEGQPQTPEAEKAVTLVLADIVKQITN